MIKASLEEGIDARIKWIHGSRAALEKLGLGLGLREIPQYTECILELSGPGFSAVWRAMSRCHPRDNYVKSTGRRLSLTKVMQKAGLDREARRAVWEAYWGAVNE